MLYYFLLPFRVPFAGPIRCLRIFHARLSRFRGKRKILSLYKNLEAAPFCSIRGSPCLARRAVTRSEDLKAAKQHFSSGTHAFRDFFPANRAGRPDLARSAQSIPCAFRAKKVPAHDPRSSRRGRRASSTRWFLRLMTVALVKCAPPAKIMRIEEKPRELHSGKLGSARFVLVCRRPAEGLSSSPAWFTDESC